MYNFERQYRTARAVFTFLEIVGWLLVCFGALVALAGFGTGGIAGMSLHDPPAVVRLIAMIPGIGILVGGLISVAFVQVGRATVDNTEISSKILNLARADNSAERSTLDISNSPKTREPGRDASTDPVFEATEIAGVEKCGNAYYSNRRGPFASMEAAKNALDQK